MKVKNPTDKVVNLNYLGEDYTIKANSSEDFPEDVAKHWVRMYEFMTLEADTPKKEEKETKTK